MSTQDRRYGRGDRPPVDHLAVQRLDATDYTKYVGVLFEKPLGETPPPDVPVPMRERPRSRLSVIGATGQFTAVLDPVHTGLSLTWREPDAAVPRPPRRSYHPSQEGSPRTAVEYLGIPPAVRAAAGAIGRSALV